ncbi:MAG: hypothetical protein AMS18_07070 [Gemmatimonas sp. SG8_17]|nr:MAG: hypothetical protein AMS18_07070 [Gemmatimonas sp. SG8_17]
MFKKLLKGIGSAVVPVVIGMAAPESIINAAVMGGIKNATPINNQAIPFINLAASTGVSYARHLMTGQDPVSAIMPALSEGGLLMAASTGLHQSLKIPIKARTGRSI